jgi:hypothetical protein
MDDDDSFISPTKDLNLPSSSFLMTKKTTTTTKQLPRLKSDKLEAGDALRGAHMECPICRKNLESLSEIRRAVHVNTCVDASVNKQAVEEAAKQAQTMFTCAFCNETVAKGPYMIAHENKCAKTFDMPVLKMITSLETQAQVAEKLRKNGFKKAAPVTTEMIQRAKKRVLEEKEEASKDLSESNSTPPVKKSASSSRKFTSGLLKSTVFGAKEKHSCRCDVLHVIQNRFCGQFKRKKEQHQSEAKKEILEKNVFQKKLEKIDRLSRLADDFRRALFSQKGDIKLITKGGSSISAHSFVIRARTSIEVKPGVTEIELTDFSIEVVELYLLYLYSGSTEWSLNDMENVRKLASLYGPSDLRLMMAQHDDDMVIIQQAEDMMMAQLDDDMVITQQAEDKMMAQNKEDLTKTPGDEEKKTRKIAARLGSGVKVIKVYDVTPMPMYEKYTDDELKEALNAFGIRPLGRKKAIDMLKNIYDEVHPFVPDLTVATPKRRPSPIPFDLDQAETSNSSNSLHDKDDNDDVLNQSMEENPEESIYFEVDETIEPSTGNSPTKGPKRINNVELGTKVMLEWLRLPENEELYTNLLAFRTVNLDELMGTIGRSSHSVQKITKKILPDVLDKLYIGFYVPDKKWKRRAGYKSG